MNAGVYVIGIGPGHLEGMTAEAVHILQQCTHIVGYTTYIRLLQKNFPHAVYFTTPMTREIERCQQAVQWAREGKRVALISGGDAGLYGMAGLVYEVSAGYEEVEIHVIAGVTAAMAGAALLGAPLVNDTCFISLSDALTPWNTIAHRLHCAASGDFVIVLYNPASKRRRNYVQKACRIIQAYRAPSTPVGVAQYIGREGEKTRLLTLKELAQLELNMISTVFIGNSHTRIIRGHMVTSRGYAIQEKEK